MPASQIERLIMKDFSDFIPFFVKGVLVNLVSTDTYAGTNTVAEIDKEYYYLGNAEPDIKSAIIAWQYKFGRTLSNEESNALIQENSLNDIDEQ